MGLYHIEQRDTRHIEFGDIIPAVIFQALQDPLYPLQGGYCMVVHIPHRPQPADLVDDVGLSLEKQGNELFQLLRIGGSLQLRHGFT